jgi:lambda family phage tail tape measure protein
LTKEESQLQLALSKGKITREEYGKALAQASQNYAAAIKGAQGLTAAEQYQAQMERQLLIQREQYAAQAAAVGMGEKEGARYMQRLQLEQQTNDRLLQLQTQYAAAKGEQQKRDIQAQIEIERQALPMRQAALEEGYRQLHAAMLNPINGWTAAVQNFGAQAADVAGQTQSVFEGAFNTITGQLTSNIMNLDLSLNSLGNTGKLMAKELVGGFVKIGVQMAANAALSSVLQSAEVVKAGATGTAIAGAYAPAAGMASIASFGGAAVAGAAAIATALPQVLSLVGFADGGFVSGPGTGRSDSIPAMLSNGEFVVNAAATKRNRALLESINSNERIAMPRGSSSGDQGGPVVVQQNVEILNYSQNQVETRTGQDGQLQVIIRSVEEYMTNSVYSGTGSFNRAVESAYGLKRQGR